MPEYGDMRSKLWSITLDEIGAEFEPSTFGHQNWDGTMYRYFAKLKIRYCHDCHNRNFYHRGGGRHLWNSWKYRHQIVQVIYLIVPGQAFERGSMSSPIAIALSNYLHLVSGRVRTSLIVNWISSRPDNSARQLNGEKRRLSIMYADNCSFR